jgi:acyl-CoA dehydrogenase
MTVEALGVEAFTRYLESEYLLASPRDLVQALSLGVVADFFYRRAATIYGGTNEVQRNIIAAQLLKGA